MPFARRQLLAVVAAAVAGALPLGALAVYSALQLARFDRDEVQRSTVVYASPLVLRPGVHVGRIDLAGTLSRLGYRETRDQPRAPGQFRRSGESWEIVPRDGEDKHPRPIRLDVEDQRITRLSRDGSETNSATLEPEVLVAGRTPGEEERPVRLEEVPPVLRDAVLAIEDERFFSHGAVDPRALARALWADLRAGRVVEGGSTLTQQLVKNRLLGPERTVGRKLAEAWLATLLEWRYSKERLFEAYLNDVYMGHWGGLAIRGVGAASRAYLGKEVGQLTLADAALLAGMIRAPNTYSPALNTARARERRDLVLARMRALGRIGDGERLRAQREPVRRPRSLVAVPLAAYFADHVRQEIEQSGGAPRTADRAARVYTTNDLPLQRFAEAAVGRGLARLETQWPRLRRPEPAGRLQAALVALDPATGRLRALVGGRDYRLSQFDRAALARRQPGSAFKPFVYLAALTARDGPPAFTAASRVEDAPVTVVTNGRSWSPRNYRDSYEGRVTVRRALELSLNAATVRVGQAAGLPAVIETARTLGLEGNLKPVPALVLGAFEVTPLDLARAYLPLANGGRAFPVRTIDAVARADGRPLWAAADGGRQVLPAAEAYLMTSLLRGVIESGTGSAARAFSVGGDIAGKTGTTNDGRDAWFVGYSSNLLVLVWVGFDSDVPHHLTGAEAALPIWADFMRQALDAYPAPPFVAPAGISIVDIDLTNGRRANAFCPLVAPEVFLAGTEPPPCEEHDAGARLLKWWEGIRDWLASSKTREAD